MDISNNFMVEKYPVYDLVGKISAGAATIHGMETKPSLLDTKTLCSIISHHKKSRKPHCLDTNSKNDDFCPIQLIWLNPIPSKNKILKFFLGHPTKKFK